jgi:hypothetical protein
MSVRRLAMWVGGLVAAGGFAWGVTWMLARADRPASPATPSAAAPLAPRARITATVFHAAADGVSLVPTRREVLLEEGVVAQGRQVLLAQVQPPPPPSVGVIPRGTTLRAFYVTRQGEAFVDLSGDLVRGHPGGATYELLTVQAIVHAVTANLPAVRRVQILIDGQEVDTIAGHVDLRRPLSADGTVLATAAAP